MATEQLDKPDLILYLQFVRKKIQDNLSIADLHKLAIETGISYSNLSRIRAGGIPSIGTLETLAYHFSPKPIPRSIESILEAKKWGTI